MWKLWNKFEIIAKDQRFEIVEKTDALFINNSTAAEKACTKDLLKGHSQLYYL